MTRAVTGWVLLEKVLEVAGLNMKTWKTRYIEYIDFGVQRVYNKVLG